MRVTVEVREEAFRTPKTLQQVEEEVRQAAAMFWLARGDVTPDGAREVAQPAPDAPVSAPPREPMLYDLLLQGPNVGEDADFERPAYPPRERTEWGT